jgi:hypothetical protein
MPLRIPSSEIQNLQQIEAVVAGPEEANRLFIINGQFPTAIIASAQANNAWFTEQETFSVLVGPTLTRKQFVKANATASIVNATIDYIAANGHANWAILNVDADWDDESGQVELRIETKVMSFGLYQAAVIQGLAFHVTILAAVAA